MMLNLENKVDVLRIVVYNDTLIAGVGKLQLENSLIYIKDEAFATICSIDKKVLGAEFPIIEKYKMNIAYLNNTRPHPFEIQNCIERSNQFLQYTEEYTFGRACELRENTNRSAILVYNCDEKGRDLFVH